MTARLHVAVVGTGDADARTYDWARGVGRELAERGAVVICGGLGGVMEAAARGADEAGGCAIGLLPGRSRADANPWLAVALPTGLGEARNALVAQAADGMVAVGGGYGTLSEIAFALKMGKPVIGLGSWELGSLERAPGRGIISAADPHDAVVRVFRSLSG